MNTKSNLAALLLVAMAVGSALTACFHDSSASSSADTSSLRIILYAHGTPKALTRRVTDRLTDAVNTPTAAPEAVTGSGTPVGVSMQCNPMTSVICYAQTATGYYVCVDTSTMDVCEPPVLYYASTDCSGTPMVTAGSQPGQQSTTGTVIAAGFVFTDESGTAWMTTAGQAVGNGAAQSQLLNGACDPVNLQADVFYQASANVPNTTDVAGPNLGNSASFGAP